MLVIVAAFTALHIATAARLIQRTPEPDEDDELR